MQRFWSDKESTKTVLKEIRSCLRRMSSREFLIFLLFVGVSFCFWVIKTLQLDYETEIVIPLKLKNVPQDVMITAELPEELQVSIKDKGTVLFYNYFMSRFSAVAIDFEDYKYQGNYVALSASDLKTRIDKQLKASTSIVTILPDTIDFVYTKAKAKTVPIALKGTIKAASKYQIADTILSQDSILVYAPPYLLSRIDTIYSKHQYLIDLQDKTTLDVELQKVKGARFSPQTIKVTLPVDVITEKVVDVPILAENFPLGKRLSTFPSSVKVHFNVGASKYKEIKSSDFVIVLSYDSLRHSTSNKVSLEISIAPKGISNITLNPSTVEYLIEQD